MSIRVLRVLGLAALFACTARSAAAAPIITFNDPAQPLGLTWTIESATQAAPADDLVPGDGNLNDTVLINLRLVTTTAYVDQDGSTNYLVALGLNVAESDLDAGVLQSFTAAPPLSGGPMVWDTHLNKDVNNGADLDCGGGNAKPGTICVEDLSTLVDNTALPNLALDAGAQYDWFFKIDLPDGGIGSTTSLIVGIATIENGDFKKIANPETYTEEIGLTVTPFGNPPVATPEPASLLLFGAGAALLASRARQRRARLGSSRQ